MVVNRGRPQKHKKTKTGKKFVFSFKVTFGGQNNEEDNLN